MVVKGNWDDFHLGVGAGSSMIHDWPSIYRPSFMDDRILIGVTALPSRPA